MAYSLTYSDALTSVQRYVNGNILDAHAAMICNIATNKIWHQYDWRESLAQFPPFYLVPMEQDFGAPTAAVPPDFIGLREVFLVRRSVTPPYREPIQVKRDIELTHIRGLPSHISYEASLNKFRLFPRVPDSCGATDYQIEGTYKKRPVKITNGIIPSTLLPFDDIYVNTMIQALKWAALDIAGDPRAGTVQMEAGNAVHTDQLALMMDSIDHMAIHEGLNSGDTYRFPSEALVSPTYVYTGQLTGLGI